MLTHGALQEIMLLLVCVLNSLCCLCCRLSACHNNNKNTTRFEGTLLLRPGKYRVKFMVDDEWRLAADWPTEMDEEGNEVCLLTVT